MAMSNHISDIDQYKKDLVVNLIWDYVLHDSLPKPLNNRVKDVMAYWESANNLKKLTHKMPDCDNYSPAGIPLKPEHLNLNEKHLMRKELEKLILNTYPDSIRKINELTNNELNSGSINSENIDANLTLEQQKIISLCEKYHMILEELHQTNTEMCNSMKEWIDLRLGVKITSLERRSELCRYKSNLVELKTKLINVQLKRFVYGGKTAVRDYMDYYLKMKEKLDNCKNEIHNYKRILNFDDD